MEVPESPDACIPAHANCCFHEERENLRKEEKPRRCYNREGELFLCALRSSLENPPLNCRNLPSLAAPVAVKALKRYALVSILHPLRVS